MIRKLRTLGITLAALVAGAVPALAQQPRPWQLGLQPGATERMLGNADVTGIEAFHTFVLWIIAIICVFVLGLLIAIMVKFNSRANPTASQTTHHTLLEVAWTIIPVFILVAIAIPSFRLLYFEDVIPKADLTIKAIGKQWYWTYEYPDNGGFMFDALMLTDDAAAKAGEPRLLGTDNHVVVPVGKTIRIITTGADVIHSWAIPSFGVKMDAVPGRINETWFNAIKEGVYYGECSELCGARHSYMPIEVDVVSQERFDAWVADAKKKFASEDNATRVAQAVN